MKLFRIFSLIYIVFLYQFFQSCTEVAGYPEVEEEIIGYANVDERLWDHFENFELVAAARGITINLRDTDITGAINSIQEGGVAGTCTYGTHRPNDIVIDQQFWNRSSAFGREEVVFHELGHCYLMRGHTEETHMNNDRVCASIMRSGTGDCFSLYNAVNRAYYLDELFKIMLP